MFGIEITNYSIGDAYTIVSKTDNVSNVVDKMIFLAAKICEKYASDIVYDITSLNEAINEGKEYDKVLAFREMGVTTITTQKINPALFKSIDAIQTWRLTHNPNSKETVLKRVYIKEEYDYGI